MALLCATPVGEKYDTLSTEADCADVVARVRDEMKLLKNKPAKACIRSQNMSNSPSTVSSVIDRARFGRFHWSLLILVAIALALEGFEMQLIGYTAPAMAETMHVSKFTFGWLFAANNFGFMIGALLLSSLGDRIGRKKMIVL